MESEQRYAASHNWLAASNLNEKKDGGPYEEDYPLAGYQF